MDQELQEDLFLNEKTFDFKKALYKALKLWYIIPIFLSIAIVIAVYVYRTTLPKYKISTMLLISADQETGPSIGSSEVALPGITLGTINNIENQLIILTSTKQIEKTLKKLDFTVSYYKKDIFLTSEIYQRSPFKIVPDTVGKPLRNAQYNIEFISDQEFILTKEKDKNFQRNHRFFEKIVTEDAQFTVLPSDKSSASLNYMNKQYSFRINTLSKLIKGYKEKILITSVQRGSSIYNISINENNVKKGIDFLNQLATQSVNYTLDKKNQIANNTISFIENQLIGVSDSLSSAKNILEDFRSRNEMMDVSMQGQVIIEKSQELEVEKSILSAQLDYFKYLSEFIQTDQDFINLLPPSSQGVDNSVLSQLITELSTLNSERASLRFNSKLENPSITRISTRIESIKKSILQQSQIGIKSTAIAINGVDKKLFNLSGQIRSLPKKEQRLLDIERKFQSTDNMYTYLIERRSEAQLAKASNTPDNEIIEHASVDGKTAPDSTRFVIIIILLGFLLPFIIILSIFLLNNKIQDQEDIEAITSLPIIGSLPSKKKKESVLSIVDNQRSILAESVRSIRTSMDYFSQEDNCKTILFTSCLAGEGKSFSALTLAISYAQLNKKTIIIDFDLRRPTLDKLLNLDRNGNGLSRFLVKQPNNQNDNHLIEHTIHPNLSVIPAGEIPPNPAELIASNQTKLLFSELKNLYDIIIIDSPPIGLVTDAILLSKHADSNLLVVRHNITPKPLLKHILKDKTIAKFKNLSILLNDVPSSSSRYSYAQKSKYYIQ